MIRSDGKRPDELTSILGARAASLVSLPGIMGCHRKTCAWTHSRAPPFLMACFCFCYYYFVIVLGSRDPGF